VYCTQFERGCGFEIVTRISFRAQWLRDLWATLAGRPHSPVPAHDFTALKELEIAPDEQLIGYFEQHPAPLSADGIDLASPAAPYLGANGVSLLVPLVTQGRLVGLLSLGEPAGGGRYSRDDLAFLTTLADEAAAAARIAQLLARQRADDQDRLQRPAGNLTGRGGVSSPTSM
jgi:GAF domain-containing protein